MNPMSRFKSGRPDSQQALLTQGLLFSAGVPLEPCGRRPAGVRVGAVDRSPGEVADAPPGDRRSPIRNNAIEILRPVRLNRDGSLKRCTRRHFAPGNEISRSGG